MAIDTRVSANTTSPCRAHLIQGSVRVRRSSSEDRTGPEDRITFTPLLVTEHQSRPADRQPRRSDATPTGQRDDSKRVDRVHREQQRWITQPLILSEFGKIRLYFRFLGDAMPMGDSTQNKRTRAESRPPTQRNCPIVLNPLAGCSLGSVAGQPPIITSVHSDRLIPHKIRKTLNRVKWG